MPSTPKKPISSKVPLAPKKRKRIVRPRQVVARQRLNFDQVAYRNYLIVGGRRVPTNLRPTQLF